jgi:predicted membrane protein DUF2142
MMPGFVAGEATYRTRRRQIAVAAVTALLALILAADALLGTRDRLAFTNNVPSQTVVAAIDPGGRMCRSNVYLPPNATGIRLYTLTIKRPGPPLALDFKAPGARIESKLPGGYPDERYNVIPIPRPGKEATGTMCVRNEGSHRVAFGGAGYASAAGSPLNVGGRAVAGDLAIEVAAPKRSMLSLAPTVFQRATVWAPPWVGRWTYYVLLAVALALVVAAVRLVLVRANPSGGGADRRPLGLPRAAVAIVALAVTNALVWAVIVPPWQAPDEIQHFAYVQYLAETGNPSVDPDATANYSEEQQYAMESGLTNTFRNSPRGRPPWRAADRQALEDRVRRDRPSRSNGGGAPSLNYTPEYYAMASIGYRLFNWGDVFNRLFGARLVSALLAGLTTLWVWLFARELFRREGFLPNTAALSVALLPQFGFIGGVANNDNLLIMFASLELYLLARSLRRGLTLRLALLIGLVLALGYLAKPSMAAFGPVVAGVLAWPAVRKRDIRLLTLPAVALAGFAAVALVWAGVAALSDRGVTTVTTANTRPFSLSDYVSYVYHFYLPSLPGSSDRWFGDQAPVYSVWMHSFFATFGWSDTQFPPRVYEALTALCIGIVVLLGAAAWRERPATRRALPLVLMSAGSVVSLLLLLHLVFYLNHTNFPGEQGRYLLPLAAIFGSAVAASTLAAGRRHAPLLATFYVTALACFTLFSYGLELTRYYT